jgi:hypothetical protein
MSSPRLPMPLFENETFNDFNISSCGCY